MDISTIQKLRAGELSNDEKMIFISSLEKLARNIASIYSTRYHISFDQAFTDAMYGIWRAVERAPEKLYDNNFLPYAHKMARGAIRTSMRYDKLRFTREINRTHREPLHFTPKQDEYESSTQHTMLINEPYTNHDFTMQSVIDLLNITKGIDKEILKVYFEDPEITLQELADKLNMPYTSLYRRKEKLKWKLYMMGYGCWD